MTTVFYTSAAVAALATLMVITRANPVHALLYLIVSLLAIAVIFLTLGAHFVAALEVIIYAGAIMVLFVFVIMMLNLGRQTGRQERAWLTPRTWIGPSILAAILLALLLHTFWPQGGYTGAAVEPHDVARCLIGTYAVAVELASMLLLAGLIGAYHLGRRDPKPTPQEGRP